LFNLICNPTKLILKGKPRHVVDSSDPHDGTSVNANTDRSQTRLSNASFAQLAALIVHEGPGAELIKFDVVSAYKLVRLPLQDYHLLGERELFAGVPHYSFSLATSFGAASSADNFHDFAEVLEFLIRLLATLLSSLARYADDFCGVVPRRALHDRRQDAALAQIYTSTHALGVPIAKVEGPTTSLVFIGTAIDTVRMIAFIPPDKLAEAITDFMLWQTREYASQKQWQSLAGTLEWLTRVVLWGRPHIAQAIRLSTKRRGARASPTFRHEISWWISVLKTNPSVPLSFHCNPPPEVIIETDASKDGFGAWSPTLARCLLGKFTALELVSAQRSASRSMGELELRAVLIALHTFAPHLAGASVLFKVDNEEARYALEKRSAKPPNQRAIIADIADLCMTHNIFISASYFPTPLPHLHHDACNRRADLLSRDQADEFFAITPAATSMPTTPLRQPIRSWPPTCIV
jgi:hypothetical protein